MHAAAALTRFVGRALGHVQVFEGKEAQFGELLEKRMAELPVSADLSTGELLRPCSAQLAGAPSCWRAAWRC